MKTTAFRTHLRTLLALGTLGYLAGVAGQAHAISSTYSFGSVTFDQALTPDRAKLLGNGETLGGVSFSPLLPNGTTSAIPNFPASSSGFNTALSLGDLTDLNTGLRGVNLPRGDNGSTTRHGIEVSWASGLGIFNGSGDDFVIFESASTQAGVEGMMVRVHIGGTENWSDWHYFATSEFGGTTGNEGLHIYKYDLSNFGLTESQGVDYIQFANLMPNDKAVDSSGQGRLAFDGSGFALNAGVLDGDGVYTGTTVYDPDPVYVASLQNLAVVPEPTSIALLIGGLGLFGCARRKRE
ncbi:MAG TPA: PEP-CTERM sorting domain-containing protein [Verrucomicrobiae bacterium]